MAMTLPVVFILLLSATTTYAVDVHVVGGTSGWTLNYDYTKWAAGENFTIGDSLLFNYNPVHKVDVVNEADYTSCNVASPITTYSGSATLINLTAAGPMYFICPTSTHCSRGMKLAVNVASLTVPTPPGAPSPPAVAAPPPPAGVKTTPAPPPANGADGGFGYTRFWMLGFLLVVLGSIMG